MNLLTDCEYQVLDRSTRKISITNDHNVDLNKYVLIKKNPLGLILVSFKGLDEYGLKSEIVDFNGRQMYMHKTEIPSPTVLYQLTKALTYNSTVVNFLESMEKTQFPMPWTITGCIHDKLEDYLSELMKESC